jgi:hypothetical protein
MGNIKNVYNCSKCKDSGKIKFVPIEWSMYSWQKWKTRDCECLKNNK